MSPEPVLKLRRTRPAGSTETAPEPLVQSISAALATLTSPDPVEILPRPMSAAMATSADPDLIA